MSQKSKKIICIISILAVIILAVALCSDNIMNAVINQTMGKDLPQLEGEPEVEKWYAIDIDNAVSSDGSKWQGYFRKGSENKVVLYFYGGGFSVNDYTAARSMDMIMYNKGPVDKSKNSTETHSGPGRIVNLEIEKDGLYHPFKV